MTKTTLLRYVVRRSFGGRTWNVIDTTNDTCIEGGFFDRSYAVDAARDWNAVNEQLTTEN
jgi:hypothetical protein